MSRPSDATVPDRDHRVKRAAGRDVGRATPRPSATALRCLAMSEVSHACSVTILRARRCPCESRAVLFSESTCFCHASTVASINARRIVFVAESERWAT